MRSLQCFLLRVTVLFLTYSGFILAQDPTPAPNSDATYQQLRSLTLGGEAVSVNNFELKRNAASFRLKSGTVCFTSAVQGKVTGGVFVGDGEMLLAAPTPSEAASLKLLTKGTDFDETFDRMVLRFTDSTYDDIKKAGSAASGGCDPGLLKDSQNTTRHKLKDNLEARILEDVLSNEPGGLFVAFVHGKRYNDKERFAIDPHSSSDQVSLMTFDENKLGIWAGFGLAGIPQSRIHIDRQQLDTTIEKSANLIGKATTTFVSQINGLRVVPFDLFPTLRVSSVTADGQALPFIQEDKNDDADFAVIVPKALAAGEKYTITTTYAGKDAVRNEGGGNYYPVARDSWYPNNPNGELGEYTSYDMTFRIPKGMKIAATGSLVSESNDGGQNVTVWKSDAPQTVAGFNFGRFKLQEVKLTNPEYLVQSFANDEPPDWVKSLLRATSSDQDLPMMHGIDSESAPQVAMGNMNTTGMIKHALAEGQVSIQLYTDYFGPTPYKRVALTQQTACSYGQSWPGLVWLPICSFFDATVRHNLGVDFGDRGYWKVVAPHEVAHQWWGHTVGFRSYRDQWMSEGFADFSASLFLQMAYAKDPKMFLTFWKDERDTLTEKNKEGFRAIDVGPLTMGYRLNNSKAGFNIAGDLIYPKGAYILHMIRMMMWDAQTRDQNFKALMHDFVTTYSGKAASTEDFRAMVEKHMTQDMDVDGNHRMDWFFNEYVYGTALPSYQMDSSFDKDANGDVILVFKATQSGVDNNFRMVIPIYLEMADGRIVNLGRMRMVGNTSADHRVPLKGLKTPPKRAMLNYNYDVLAAN
jgi:hypothetical protein